VPFVQVTSRGDVTRLSAAVMFVTLSIVTLIIALTNRNDDFLRVILIAWTSAGPLSFSSTFMLGLQMLKVHVLNTELQRLVNRDRLTDVATRDFFFARLAEKPGSYGVSLMADIDSFKTVNDTYGHQTGDKVITRVARILAQEVGARDIVCRFGGEEFVVFLDNATRTNALDVSERIRAGVEAATVDSEGSSVSVTVSIGGSLRKAAAEIDEAIRQADAALYRAKKLGRNRVAMYADLAQEAEAAEGHSTSIRTVPRPL